MRIGSNKVESFAYADDIMLYGATVPGLQKMIDKCLVYSNTILTFVLETVYLNRAMYGKLQSLQGTIVKAFLGLNRYSHHSKLLTALGILPIEESIKSMSVSLMKRIFLVNSPVRSLCSFFISKYLLTGKYSKSTLFGRLAT